jgi:hypothetical protein
MLIRVRDVPIYSSALAITRSGRSDSSELFDSTLQPQTYYVRQAFPARRIFLSSDRRAGLSVSRLSTRQSLPCQSPLLKDWAAGAPSVLGNLIGVGWDCYRVVSANQGQEMASRKVHLPLPRLPLAPDPLRPGGAELGHMHANDCITPSILGI